MKKLKIVDSYDMRNLVDFGFKNIDYVNTFVYKYETDNFNYIIGPDRIIHYNQFTIYNVLDNVIYELINARIVECVENE